MEPSPPNNKAVQPGWQVGLSHFDIGGSNRQDGQGISLRAARGAVPGVQPL